MEILPANKKRIIVNADDFGLSPNINRGIIEAVQAGVVKSASMLANGEAVDDALERAGKRPELGIGLHLSVVFGKPISPSEKIPSLIFAKGEFARGYGQFLRRYLTGGVKLAEVEYEWEQQREKLDSLEIDHLDSHQHLHLLPGLFKLAVRLAEKWGIPYVRIPWENIRIGIKGNAELPKKVLNMFSCGKRTRLRENNLHTTDNFFGSSFSGALTNPVWRRLMPSIPAGLTEIMCHPGREDADFRSRHGWTSRWEEELEALLDPDLKETADRLGIVFTNFKVR